MSELSAIAEYVNKITHIIGTVLNVEVLIYDSEGSLLGTTHIVREKLSHSSILSTAMKQGDLFIDMSIETPPNCMSCPKKDVCDVVYIIGLPIRKKAKVIGAIGLYASDEETKEKMIERRSYFVGFIREMADLIVRKESEEQESMMLKDYHKRLSLIIESLDQALISLDDEGQVVHYNSKFLNLFSLEHENKLEENIQKLLLQRELHHFIHKGKGERETQISFKIRGKLKDIIVKISPIEVDTKINGSIITFQKASDLYREINRISNPFSLMSFDDIIGSSMVFQKLKENARRFARSASTILLQGESGTGKDVLARAIHHASGYSKGPFVSVNCAAIPEALLESELFGHEEGSFTGSMKGGKVGKFELANKGTLFLDEIGELPLHLQPKLLRTLQDKKVQRVGSNRSIQVDIRIITATNRDLAQMVERREFREDLYYRLNVIPLTIPPLRERGKDIMEFLHYFLSYYNQILARDIDGFSSDAENLLYHYHWPGNIRELQNVVEYAVNIAEGQKIQVTDLPAKTFGAQSDTTSFGLEPLDQIESKMIQLALQTFGTDLKGKEQAALTLGISLATFYRKLKRYDLFDSSKKE